MKHEGPGGLMKIVSFILLAAAAGLLTTGCKTYQQQNKVITYWRQGELSQAVAEATKKADDHANGKDAIVWRLEQGAALRADGQYAASTKAFDQAEQKMADYAREAKVRLGQETGALLSNQANLDYEGRSYDGIMLDTYKALNYLALGEPDKARPELIHAYQRQQDAVAENRRRIEKVQAEAQENQDSRKIRQSEENPAFQSQLQSSLSGINDIQPYADYINPFTVYLDGIYFMANAVDASDLERAHKALARVASVVPDNRYVQEDVASVNGLLNQGKALPPTTYVIFETGCAPVRDQKRIDIPIIFSKVSYLGAAFPILVPQGDFAPVLNVAAGGASYKTELVASMDRIIVRDYKNELPVVITKTIAATVAKAVAAYAANEAVGKQNQLAGLIMQVATAAYEMAVNIADTRTWTTLPKEFEVCRFPTPADGKIELSTPDGMKAGVTLLGSPGGAKIDLTSGGAQATLTGGGRINVVYVKSITAGTPLIVSQFIL